MTIRARPLPPTRPRRFRRGDESGAALVEFSLVFALFVFVLYALIYFGMFLAAKQSVTNAASEAARSAIGAADPVAAANATISSRLGSLYNSPAPTVGPCASDPSHNCITVTVTRNDPPVPPAPGLSILTPGPIKSTAVVQIS